MNNRFRKVPETPTSSFPDDATIKRDLLIGLWVFLACFGPIGVMEHARSHGLDGPVALVPGLIALLTGLVPLAVAMGIKLRVRRALKTQAP